MGKAKSLSLVLISVLKNKRKTKLDKNWSQRIICHLGTLVRIRKWMEELLMKARIEEIYHEASHQLLF